MISTTRCSFFPMGVGFLLDQGQRGWEVEDATIPICLMIEAIGLLPQTTPSSPAFSLTEARSGVSACPLFVLLLNLFRSRQRRRILFLGLPQKGPYPGKNLAQCPAQDRCPREAPGSKSRDR